MARFVRQFFRQLGIAMPINATVNLSMQRSERGDERFNRRVFLESLRLQPAKVISAGAWLFKERVDDLDFRLAIRCCEKRKSLEVLLNHARSLPAVACGGAGMTSPHRLQVRSFSSAENSRYTWPTGSAR